MICSTQRKLCTLMVLLLAILAPAVHAQIEPASDKWSPDVRKAMLTTPDVLSRAVHLELRDTWRAVVTPTLRDIVGDDARIQATVFSRNAGEGRNYVLFTARGQTAERCRVPAHGDTSARRRPVMKVEYQIFLHRDELAAVDGGTVSETRDDGNVSTMKTSFDDRRISIEVSSTDGTANAEKIGERLMGLLEGRGINQFPTEVSMDPIKPSANMIQEPAKPALPPVVAIGEDATDEFEYVTMETTEGSIVLALNTTKAPVSVANFLSYVDAEFYDNTIFHRVMSTFMIQGGGFTSQLQQKSDGLRPGIDNEWQNGLKHARGTLAMARVGGNPRSATAQFFINVVDNSMLDRPQSDGAGYAVFGKV
ncbi:MAG: peptidylprolyl isomerase, partial [Planctomycetota bacterium]